MIRLTIWLFRLSITLFCIVAELILIFIRALMYRDPPLDISYEDYHVETDEMISAELSNTRTYRYMIMQYVDGQFVPTGLSTDDIQMGYAAMKHLRQRNRQIRYILQDTQKNTSLK